MIAIDQRLSRHGAIAECDDARIAIELCVRDETRHQSRMQRAKIRHRCPDLASRRVE